jgi:hypothetical protein
LKKMLEPKEKGSKIEKKEPPKKLSMLKER